MAVTTTDEKATLAVRIRNGQSDSGAWKYKYTNITGIKADFGSEDDKTKASAIGEYMSAVLVGTTDGLRLVKTSALVSA